MATWRSRKLIDEPNPLLAVTKGVNHVGLAVLDLQATGNFFLKCLGWEEVSRDDSYPRQFITDGTVLLTLWQVDHELNVEAFNRRKNVGLHHLALTVSTEGELDNLATRLADWSGVEIEFMPEQLRNGPAKHMMIYEPGGIRLEFIWPGK